MKKTTLIGSIICAVLGAAGAIAFITAKDCKKKKVVCPECDNDECPIDKRAEAVGAAEEFIVTKCGDVCDGAKKIGAKTKAGAKKIVKKVKARKRVEFDDDITELDSCEQLMFDLDEDVTDVELVTPAEENTEE